MVENRPILNANSHILLLLGVAVTLLPIWITFVASTHASEELLRAPIPMWPGDQLWQNYAEVLSGGITGAGGVPVGVMMLNSLVMALSIAYDLMRVDRLGEAAAERWSRRVVIGCTAAAVMTPSGDWTATTACSAATARTSFTAETATTG